MNKQNAKLRRRPQILIIPAFLILLVVAIIMCYGTMLRQEVYAKETKSKNLKITWENKKWTGTYEGELSGSKPSGSGTFTSKNQALIYEGEWSNGKFNGTGIIYYKDGTWEEGRYSLGKRNGVCRFYASDTEYVERYYSKGVPYGKTCTYENNTLTDTDYYVNSILVSDLRKEASLLSSDNLHRAMKEGEYITVRGTVAFVGEDSEHCYFRINTDSVGMVIGSYKNQIGETNGQAYMPSMTVGDQIQIYGYCIGKATDNFAADLEGYQYEFPSIDPLYGENLSGQAEKTDADSYAFLLNNPYERFGERVKDTFTVLKVNRNGKKYYIQAIPTDTSRENELFTLCCKSDADAMFYTGQILTISGYYAGQYKYLRSDEPEQSDIYDRPGISGGAVYTYSYDIVPAIRVTKIQ